MDDNPYRSPRAPPTQVTPQLQSIERAPRPPRIVRVLPYLPAGMVGFVGLSNLIFSIRNGWPLEFECVIFAFALLLFLVPFVSLRFSR